VQALVPKQGNPWERVKIVFRVMLGLAEPLLKGIKIKD